MLAPLEVGRRVADARVLVLLGAACVLCGLVAWSSAEHSLASIRAPALVLYVPSAGLGPAAVPGPGPRMAPAASGMTPPSEVIPTTVDSPRAQMPIRLQSTDPTPQSLPPAVEPRGQEALMSPLQLFWGGLAASVAIIVMIIGMRIRDRLQKNGDPLKSSAGGLPVSTTTLPNAADDSLEHGVVRGRSGFLAMTATLNPRVDDATVEAALRMKNSTPGDVDGQDIAMENRAEMEKLCMCFRLQSAYEYASKQSDASAGAAVLRHVIHDASKAGVHESSVHMQKAVHLLDAFEHAQRTFSEMPAATDRRASFVH